MIYEPSLTAVGVFAFFVLVVLGISFYLGAKVNRPAATTPRMVRFPGL